MAECGQRGGGLHGAELDGAIGDELPAFARALLSSASLNPLKSFSALSVSRRGERRPSCPAAATGEQPQPAGSLVERLGAAYGKIWVASWHMGCMGGKRSGRAPLDAGGGDAHGQP